MEKSIENILKYRLFFMFVSASLCGQIMCSEVVFFHLYDLSSMISLTIQVAVSTDRTSKVA